MHTIFLPKVKGALVLPVEQTTWVGKWSSVQLTAQSRSEGFLAFWLTPVREPSFIPQIMLPVLRLMLMFAQFFDIW